MTVTTYRDPGSSQTISYAIDSDPSVTGLAAEVGALAARTDVPSIYFHMGPSDLDWVLVGTSVALPPPPPAPLTSAMFYGLTAGTGNAGPNDYAATVAVGAAVPFPRNGPSVGAGIARTSSTQFQVTTPGTYEVSWSVATLEESQFQLAVNAAPQPSTTTLSGAGTQENVNSVLLTLAALDVLTLINPAGNATALTVQTADGSMTNAQAPNLKIKFIG